MQSPDHLDHATLVETSGSIAANIGLWRHWADPIPSSWGKGEHPDRFGLFNRYCAEIWRDDEGAPVEANAGDTFVFECKASVSDAKKDGSKPWRQRGVIAAGNFRAFVAPCGVIDPADLVGTPWGLWEVDDAGEFVMVRAPQRIHQTNRAHEIILVIGAYEKGAGSAKGGRGKTKQSSLGRSDEIEAELARNGGSMSVGKLRKALNIKTRADLLADELSRDRRFVVTTEQQKSMVELSEQTQEA